jgi:hypothetical protein
LKIKKTHFCFKTKMSAQLYSRDYLQSMPEQRKQQEINGIVGQFQGELLNAAASGKTSYMYVRQIENRPQISWPSHSPPPLTDAELVAGFFTRFPGCKIYYEESWVESGPTTRVLKKGIVIDWS